MILTVDVGNSSVKIGGFENGSLVFRASLTSSCDKSEDEYAAMLAGIFSLNGKDPKAVSSAVMLSVVPSLTHRIKAAVEKLCKTPAVVGAGIKTGLNIKTQNPSSVGSDIVAAAVGAMALKKTPLIIVDLGTATTISVINEKKEFCGCAIAPGAALCIGSLSQNCSLIGETELQKPESILGTNTAQSVNSGCLFGTAMAVDGFVEKIKSDFCFETEPTVIATGGLCKSIVPLCKSKIEIVENLTLFGLYKIYQLNQKK